MRSIYQWLQEIYHSIAYRLRCLAFYLAQKCQSGFAFGEGEKRPTMPFSHNGVRFPVAQTLVSIDDDRSLIDAHPVWELPTAIITAVTLLTLLLAAQMAVEVAPRSFIRQDVLIRSFRD